MGRTGAQQLIRWKRQAQVQVRVQTQHQSKAPAGNVCVSAAGERVMSVCLHFSPTRCNMDDVQLHAFMDPSLMQTHTHLWWQLLLQCDLCQEGSHSGVGFLVLFLCACAKKSRKCFLEK